MWMRERGALMRTPKFLFELLVVLFLGKETLAEGQAQHCALQQNIHRKTETLPTIREGTMKLQSQDYTQKPKPKLE